MIVGWFNHGTFDWGLQAVPCNWPHCDHDCIEAVEHVRKEIEYMKHLQATANLFPAAFYYRNDRDVLLPIKQVTVTYSEDSPGSVHIMFKTADGQFTLVGAQVEKV